MRCTLCSLYAPMAVIARATRAGSQGADVVCAARGGAHVSREERPELPRDPGEWRRANALVASRRPGSCRKCAPPSGRTAQAALAREESARWPHSTRLVDLRRYCPR